ncbi:unnamed protein product [Closterium sp. NIES-65]|nr:unnamed protein product [Closterium sp. NIES-65]
MTGQGMASGASFESDARMNAAALPANMLVAAQGGDQACTFKLENEACSFSDPFLLQVEPGPVQKSDLPYAQLTPAEIINGAPFSGVPKGVPCASAQQETFRYLSAALGACEPLDPALYTCQNLDDPNLDMPLQELEAVESLLGVTPYTASQPGQPGQPGQSSQVFSPIRRHDLYSTPQSCFAGDGSGVSALLTHPASVFPSPVILI